MNKEIHHRGLKIKKNERNGESEGIKKDTRKKEKKGRK
jgi:hypothetical protein